MGGGLINIVAYGSNDLYLTGVPQITYFKFIYRRHTNFSTESIPINIEDNLEFSELSEIIIPSIGDAVHKTFLQIDIPSVKITKQSIGLDIQSSPVDTSVEDYNKVLSFMDLNTKSYRIAYQSISIENITTLEVIESALDQFLDITVEDINNNTNTTIINNFKTLITGDFYDNQINLQTILDNYRTKITTEGLLLTKDSLKKLIDLAIEKSITVQEYYFNKKIESENNINDVTSSNIKFAWNKNLGHTIIDYIDVFIGGEKIDRHYGTWIDIWYELTGNKDQKKNYDKMIGNVPELITFDNNEKTSYSLYIPLNFWFCKYNGLAFPLVALQYCDLVFSIKLKRISECAYIERIVDSNNNELFISLDDIWDDLGYSLSGKLLLDYIFMEHTERRKFSQSSHEYLIDVVQRMYVNNINFEKVQIELDFKHPCKELFWIAQKQDLLTNPTSYTKTFNTTYSYDTSNSDQTNNYFHDIYSYNEKSHIHYNKLDKIKNPFMTSKLDLNGYTRLDNFDGNYYNCYQPLLRHRNTPIDGINIYSFSLHPEQHQPSGTCNFSRIPSSIMTFQLDPKILNYKLSDIRPDIQVDSGDDIVKTNNVVIYIYATSYNILRISGGFGGLSYS